LQFNLQALQRTKMLRLRRIKKDEKIAVAIPTKNRPSYLAVLLNSLLNQTYTNFMIVINDQSNSPVERDDALTDLLAVAKNIGHEIKIIRTKGGWKRHQQAMEAVPEPIEFIRLEQISGSVVFKVAVLEGKVNRKFYSGVLYIDARLDGLILN